MIPVRTCIAVVGLLVAPLVLAACGGSGGSGGPDSISGARDVVQAAARDVAQKVAGPDVEVVEATGQWSICSTGTSDRVEYGAALGLRAGGDPVALVRSVGEQLADAGYAVTNEGDTSVNLEGDDGVKVSARQSRANPDQVTVEVSTDCVDGTRDDVPNLEPEPIDLG